VAGLRHPPCRRSALGAVPAHVCTPAGGPHGGRLPVTGASRASCAVVSVSGSC
jgi:hypothetical protein